MRRSRFPAIMTVALAGALLVGCAGPATSGFAWPTGTAPSPAPVTAPPTPTPAPATASVTAEPTVTVLPTPTPMASTSPSPAPTPSPTATPPAAARWVPAGTMKLARSYFAALPLADGTVLVVGHDNTCTPGGANEDSVEAELFDGTDAWARTAPLNAPRDGFASVRLRDGRVLVTGGYTGVTATAGVLAYSSARIYDPQTGTWAKPGLMHVARYQPSAALLADGRVLVAGGVYADENSFDTRASAELFDPGTGKWSVTGSMKTARSAASAVTLDDGRVLVVGGVDSDGDPLRTAEVFDPDSGRWSSAGSLAKARAGFTLTLLPDGSVLAVGGDPGGSWASDKPLASAERFDPSSGTWSPAASMATPRTLHVAALLEDGTVLVAGGNDRALVLPSGTSAVPGEPGGAIVFASAPGDARVALTPLNAFPPPTASTEIYDPVTDSWSTAAPMASRRAAASAVALDDGSVLVIGGYGSWGQVSTPYCPNELATAERYLPAGG